MSSNKIPRRSILKAAAGAAGAAIAPTSLTAQTTADDLADTVQLSPRNDSFYKRRARSDYKTNMMEFGGALSSDQDDLEHAPRKEGQAYQFDVAIVGSGYGASICAARLAPKLKSGNTLCILERGREWVPGTFPDTTTGALREGRLRATGPKKNELKNPLGLFSMLQNKEVNVLTGSGLGGGSLINANVAIVPDKEVFEQHEWPEELRNFEALLPYYNRVRNELGIQTEPTDITPKMRAQRLAGKRLASCGCVVEPADLSIFRGKSNCDLPTVNGHGLIQRACINCGDCTTGCNVGAKNNLSTNYLPMARRAGAKIFTKTEVVSVQKFYGFYRINYRRYSLTCDGYQSTCGSVTARMVILGAGSIGSTEILLRSWAPKLEFSPKIGYNWTGNGDALGFVTRSAYGPRSFGVGANDDCEKMVGPTIQTNMSYPYRAKLNQRCLIQDGSSPKAYAKFLKVLVGDIAGDQTEVLLGMGHDGHAGRLTLRNNGLAKISWPGLKDSAYRKFIRKEFEKVAQGHDGKYKYLKAFGDNFISVHPLGGCNMADDPKHGVVNAMGQVFDAESNGSQDRTTGKAKVHEGLYVVDGAVIPRSLGCNPYLTISALAEKIAEQIPKVESTRDMFKAA